MLQKINLNGTFPSCQKVLVFFFVFLILGSSEFSSETGKAESESTAIHARTQVTVSSGQRNQWPGCWPHHLYVVVPHMAHFNHFLSISSAWIWRSRCSSASPTLLVTFQRNRQVFVELFTRN